MNATGADGSTALLTATAEESVDSVAYLLAHGADVNAKIDGSTALHLAVEDGNEQLVELLLAHGADPEVQNESDETALESAEDLDSPRITRMLRAAVRAEHQHGH